MFLKSMGVSFNPKVPNYNEEVLYLEYVPDLLVGHHEDLHGRPDVGELSSVVPTLAHRTTTLHMNKLMYEWIKKNEWMNE